MLMAAQFIFTLVGLALCIPEPSDLQTLALIMEDMT